jgi:flp pilus assembly protein cpaB
LQWLLFPRIFYKEENDLKIFRNRTVIGVLCILLALIICFGVTPLFSRSASEKTEIVRVTKDIKEGDEITAEMVQTVEVGAYNLPQNLMTDKKEVVGKYATADLAAGDYILSSKLSAVPAAENAYLYNLDGKKQAISVTIKSFATGLSGKLESGDIVTVIVADYQGKGETAIPPELQYVEVISVTASSGYDANTGEVVDEKELPSTVTLLVTTEQAKVLAELEQDSELHLALVYRGTPENAAKFIAAQDALIEELYAEPEPESSGETAEGTESKESEGAEPSAESEATE